MQWNSGKRRNYQQLEVDKDIEDCKCNIIIYKVPEDLTAELSTRKDNDLQFVTDMLDVVFHLKLQNTDTQISKKCSNWEDFPEMLKLRDRCLRDRC